MNKKPSKECIEAMKAAETPGVSPATFDNCGYQLFKVTYTRDTPLRAMRRCFIHIRAEMLTLSHEVSICGYYGHSMHSQLAYDMTDFSLTLYLKKL